MKRTVRIFALLLALCLCLSTAVSAAADAPRYTNEADILHALGLFNGTDKGFELERTPTRTEALVLLIRLLGKQAEAEACADANPFTDVPAWADRFVTWAYSQGLTKGVTDTEFGGTAAANAKMFLTFILRALGYDDSAGDFSYDTALTKSADIGLISPDSYDGAAVFYRDDCAHLCYAALTTKLNHSGKTLVSKLVSEGVISAETARQHKLLPEAKSLNVACVGDSFTAGYDLSDPGTEAFPAVMATLSGDYSFQTENYGVAGVAVNNESFLSYLKSGVCARSLQTKAAVILVTLGANDAVWVPDMSDFREDYKQLLETYIKLPHAPKVIVMTPPRLLGLKGYDALMAQIVREETAAARELNLDIIDIYAFSDGMEGYSDDSVHFNAQGHRLVAEFIYDELSDILSRQP